jgi:hypothetical protein
MIEVEANILRGSCMPVFFVGEQIECEIKFTFIPNSKEKLYAGTAKKTRQELELQQKELKQKDNYILDHSFDCENHNNNVKMNEITESMFSMLSNYQSQVSSQNSSVASTPLTVPNSILYKNINYAKSFQSFLTTNYSNINNKPEISYSEASLTDDMNHIVAWACAQIDCNCYIDESKVILPKDPLRYGNSEQQKLNSANDVATSFQPNKDRMGISVYSSKPKILFCNLLLRQNETRSCN